MDLIRSLLLSPSSLPLSPLSLSPSERGERGREERDNNKDLIKSMGKDVRTFYHGCNKAFVVISLLPPSLSLSLRERREREREREGEREERERMRYLQTHAKKRDRISEGLPYDIS